LAALPDTSTPISWSGSAHSDDAAVYRITDEIAIVSTVDSFRPSWTIPTSTAPFAATNSMSDVYAMGGQVLFALNVAALPGATCRGADRRGVQGGADKVVEAGASSRAATRWWTPSPNMAWPSPQGRPKRIFIKGGLRPGHRLFLSKPLRTGVIATAAKDDACEPAVLEGAVQSMLRLNRAAADVAREAVVRGATDISGFGLLGHAAEMVEGIRCGYRAAYSGHPMLRERWSWPRKGTFSEG